MRVAVMAAGAVGGYFGGRLAAAGHDVAFIARGAHRDAIRRNGLKIESGLGDLHLQSVDVTDDASEIGPVDLVLFAVKLWDTETAGEQTRHSSAPKPPSSRFRTASTALNGLPDPGRRRDHRWNDLCGRENSPSLV